jgi:hypothetical protein
MNADWFFFSPKYLLILTLNGISSLQASQSHVKTFLKQKYIKKLLCCWLCVYAIKVAHNCKKSCAFL